MITSPSTYNGWSHRTPECRNIENQRRSRDDLPVSTVMTTFLPIERSAPISVCMSTHSSTNLEEAHLQKHSTANLWLLIPTEEDLSTIEAHSGGEAFPQLKRIYGGDTLRSMKCIYGQRPTQFRKLSTTTTMTTMTMIISEHKDCGQSKFTYPMNDLRLQLH